MLVHQNLRYLWKKQMEEIIIVIIFRFSKILRYLHKIIQEYNNYLAQNRRQYDDRAN